MMDGNAERALRNSVTDASDGMAVMAEQMRALRRCLYSATNNHKDSEADASRYGEYDLKPSDAVMIANALLDVWALRADVTANELEVCCQGLGEGDEVATA